jgi:hypothetical protein
MGIQSFSAEQVKVLLKGYCQGMIGRKAVLDMLGIEIIKYSLKYCVF